jgi:hypothetical protein
MLALVTAVICTGGVARALEEGDEDYDHALNADKRLIDTFLTTLGLKSTNVDIDYRERSPLVVPPRRDLPAPEVNAAGKNPAWPVDPEAKMRKDAAAARKNSKTTDIDPSKPIAGTGALDAKGTARDYPEGRDKMKDEPGLFTRLFSGKFDIWGGPAEEVGTFTAEPPRVTLTEPPPGYQTPSPSAPYGVTKRAGAIPKPEPKY